MKKVHSILASLFILLMLTAAQCGSTPAKETPAAAGKNADIAAPDIKIMEPFARASIPNGAVYMHLMNEGEADDRLISVETDVAETAELHETTIDENEVMQMKPIHAVELPAGGSATLAPGGMHIMLMGLKQGLATGDTFELTLNFEQSGSQTIQVEVREGLTVNHDMDHSMDEGEMGHDPK